MAYTKTEWKARQGVNLNKYTKTDETVTSVVLTNTPDSISEPGIPFSAENMNHIEQGIYDAHQDIADLQTDKAPLESPAFTGNVIVPTPSLDAIGKTAVNAEWIHQRRVIGRVEGLDFDPGAEKLALWRLLPAFGQLIQISLYQDLCDLEWVGAANNATAEWWYRCNADDTLSSPSRNVNGLYMRVRDYRGVFPRFAGQNSLYKAANDTPYEGKDVGSYLDQALKEYRGHVLLRAFSQDGYPGAGVDGNLFYSYGEQNNSAPLVHSFQDSGQNCAPFFVKLKIGQGGETRPAGISLYPVVSY